MAAAGFISGPRKGSRLPQLRAAHGLAALVMTVGDLNTLPACLT